MLGLMDMFHSLCNFVPPLLGGLVAFIIIYVEALGVLMLLLTAAL